MTHALLNPQPQTPPALFVIDGSESTARARRRSELIFRGLALASIALALLVLGALIVDVAIDGLPRLSWQFLTNFPSRFAAKAGVYSALVGSIAMLGLTGVIALPLGVGAAIYLEEYASRNRFTRFIELNIANLAGVPSIIYGLLGLQVFVRMANFDRSLLAGSLTMALLILPVIIIASREALRAVPRSIREAAIALGASKWQTVSHQVLPLALPGIMTGCILAFARAIGETAPLITIGALTYIAFLPDSIFAPFTVLPIQAFNWISRPQEAFHANAAATIVLVLVVLISFNALAIWLRYRHQKKNSW